MNLTLLERDFAQFGSVHLNVLSLSTFVITLLAVATLAALLHRILLRVLLPVGLVETQEQRSIARIAAVLVLVLGFLVSLEQLGIATSSPLLTLGGSTISIYSLALFFGLAGVVLTGSQIASRLVSTRLLSRTEMDEGLRYAIGRITYYVLLVLGMIAVFQTIGIQLGSLTVILGALGVGIGFGLQNIVNNFVSGLILLFERPIKVGDWIDLQGVNGRVSEIGARSTKVITTDNITIIIPNGDCLSQRLTNWSYAGSRIRLRFPLAVAFGAEMEQVRRCLQQVAADHPNVLSEPPPKVLLTSFTGSGIELELAVWILVGSIALQQLRSDLYFGIEASFRDHGIEIPRAQQEIRVSTPIQVQMPADSD